MMSGSTPVKEISVIELLISVFSPWESEPLIKVMNLLRSIIVFVQAGVIRLTIYGNPFRAVDSSLIDAGGTDGKGAGDLDPAVLLNRNMPDLINNLGKILVLKDPGPD
jgi:hypothetical protein